MCKIREGRFSLDGEAWQGVSEEAKELVRGEEGRRGGRGWEVSQTQVSLGRGRPWDGAGAGIDSGLGVSSGGLVREKSGAVGISLECRPHTGPGGEGRPQPFPALLQGS